MLGWDSDDIRSVCAQLQAEGLLREDAAGAFAAAEDTPDVTQRRSAADELRASILAYMEPSEVYSAQELAEALDTSVSRVRYALPKLIEKELVRATAGTHSRNRRYTLA